MRHDPKNPMHLGAYHASYKVRQFLQDKGLLEGCLKGFHQVMVFECDLAEIIVDAMEHEQGEQDGLA